MSGLRIVTTFVCMAASVVFAEVESSSSKTDEETPVEVRDARLIYKNALAYNYVLRQGELAENFILDVK